MDIFLIEVFIKKEHLTANDIADGRNVIKSNAIGIRNKSDILNYLLTKGVHANEGKRIETIFPAHCIERIVITNTKKEA